MRIRKSLLGLAIPLALGVGTAGTASAATVMEMENNGTFATANGTLSGTNEYHGDISPSQDVDIWAFNLGTGTTFSVDSLTMYGVYSGVFDINLVLFNSAGQSVASNSGNLNSSVSDLFSYSVTSGGTYYLTVSAYQNVPLDAFGNDLGLSDGSWYNGTTFDHWSGQSFGSGHYGLEITSTVPVPAAAWLFGSGLIGLLGAARRRISAT
jgi:hypothetical protein